MSYKYELGIIGCGKMGQGVLSGLLKSKAFDAGKICATRRTKEGVKEIRSSFPGVDVFSDNKKLVKNSRILLICVKPYAFSELGKTIASLVARDQIIVSLAAGVSIRKIENTITSLNIAGRQKVVRIMPNMGCIVSESMTAMCDNGRLSADEMKEIDSVISSLGKVIHCGEDEIDIATGLSGSSFAFLSMMIEALSDAAVAEGMPRERSYEYATQAMLGGAKLLRDTGMHPGVLKDKLCSPKGTTIEAVNTLERAGFKGTVMDAMRACIQKARSLNENK